MKKSKPLIKENRHVKGSDTDSVYFVMTPLLEKLYPGTNWEDPNNKKLKIEKLLKITDYIQHKANENLFNISKNLFNIPGKHYFELKQEVIAEKVYWAGKRRYAMYIINKEGLEIEELDIKGMDIMKSNFPPLFRNFGKQLLQDILFSKPKKEIDKNVLDFKNSLPNIDWRELLKPTGVKKIDEYIESPPNEGEIFSVLRKRCPINTRGAIVYNDLIKHKKLNAKYPEFRIGDKMYLAYLKANPMKLDVIGLNGYDDPPYIIEFIEKYIDREGIFDSVYNNK